MKVLMKMTIRVVATDIDGTLTLDRNKYELLPEVVSRIQLLESIGVRTILVTANALPIAIGLARYVGASGVVAENGCMVAYFSRTNNKNIEIKELCEWPKNVSLDSITKILLPYAVESWQNTYRRCDFAYIPIDKQRAFEGVDALNSFLKSHNLDNYISVGYSGYAIHVHPSECNKLKGLSYILSVLGFSMNEVLAIGDSSMDVDIVKNARIGVAVSNSDEELKRVAKYVTKHPSGFGFIEAIDQFILLQTTKPTDII